jgi:hypothetical protein
MRYILVRMTVIFSNMLYISQYPNNKYYELFFKLHSVANNNFNNFHIAT